MPLRKEVRFEPLRLALGTLTALGPDEHAVIQVLARPATSAAQRHPSGDPSPLALVR
jgi:hypothetical protein